jgi:hypothetical protein
LKFGTIVVLSNAVLLAFILFLFLLPVVVLGPGTSGVFWQNAWPAAVFFLLILLGINLFYALNFRLYYLLEREDWPALARYLEKQVIEKGRYHSLGVRLLSNAYFVLSDIEALANLENRVAAAKPVLIEKLALIFGTGRILRKDYAGAVRFFADRLARPAPPEASWLSWYSGFALLLDSRYTAAAECFSNLARSSENPAAAALAAWFLGQVLPSARPEQSGDLAILAEQGRKRVKAMLPGRQAWDKKTEALRGEIYAVLISKYLQDAADWLYNDGPGPRTEQPRSHRQGDVHA